MKDNLDRYIERIENLPVTPTILVKLITVFRKQDRDVDEIVELMGQDPALTAEVLRYANSSYFGHEEPVADVFEAIMRVGFHKVYETALARLGLQVLSLPQRAYAIDVVAIWRHSAAAAATAGAIARNVEEPGGLAFTAGLLHDVGKIVLASAEGGKYGQLLEDLGQNGSSLEPIEAKFFGFGHGEIGGRLLERWGLPFDVSVPVRYHHRADWAAPFQRRCAIVSLSNCMAHAAESTKPEQRHYDSEEAIAAMRLLELTEESVGLIMQEARSDIKRFTGMKVAKTR